MESVLPLPFGLVEDEESRPEGSSPDLLNDFIVLPTPARHLPFSETLFLPLLHPSGLLAHVNTPQSSADRMNARHELRRAHAPPCTLLPPSMHLLQ